MRIVTTGGAGFIGSTLVHRLLSEGHRVLAVDHLSTGHLDNLADSADDPRLTFLKSDLVGDAARREMTSYQAEVFFHLAAQMDVRHSVADPLRYARNNVLGCLAALESARSSGARKLVFLRRRRGEATRDYVYVDDVVEAFVLAAGSAGEGLGQHRHRVRDLGAHPAPARRRGCRATRHADVHAAARRGARPRRA